MKTQRTLIALGVAIFLSGTLTLWLSHAIRRSSRTALERLHYAVPARPLEAGDVLSADNVSLLAWPADAPLPGAFTRKEDTYGRAVLYPLSAGEPILSRQLGDPSAGLSARIPQGMRAISLKSNEVVGVAGYLLPGTRVDVLATIHEPGSLDSVTSTILEDAQVLTAGQKMQPDPDGKATRVDVVTLLVSPDNAEKVVLASTQGTLHFVLRNGADHIDQPSPAMHLSSLASTQQNRTTTAPALAAPQHLVTRERAQAPTAPRYTIQMMRGDKQSVETF
jgi:pilus assembly protein CpaB